MTRQAIEAFPETCIEWDGPFANRYKYGIVSLDGHRLLAHRLAYRLFHGKIPRGFCVCHSCDNPKCFNPKHLWVGTQKENMQDAHRKGRLPRQLGRSLIKRCPMGHPYDEHNTISRPLVYKGKAVLWRACRECMNAYNRRRRQDPIYRVKSNVHKRNSRKRLAMMRVTDD